MSKEAREAESRLMQRAGMSLTRYQEEHYRDVARIIRYHTDLKVPAEWQKMAQVLGVQFANLFAADNTAICEVCGQREPADEDFVDHTHNFEGGFDRERFLKACGLEGPWNEAVDSLADSIDDLRAGE